MSANGDAVVAKAREGIGRTENSRHLCSPYTDVIGAQPWCGGFVDYVYKAAIGVDLKKYTSNPFYVSTCHDDMERKGFLLDVGQRLPGDICFFNWDGGREDHMGIVVTNEAQDPESGVRTIDGNVSNSVKEQNRGSSKRGFFAGVARIPEIVGDATYGTGGYADPDAPAPLPLPVGMDYGLNYFAPGEDEGDDDVLAYEGGLQYAAHDQVIGWNTSSMGRGVGTKFHIWTQRGNYSLDTISVVWDFAGRANPD